MDGRRFYKGNIRIRVRVHGASEKLFMLRHHSYLQRIIVFCLKLQNWLSTAITGVHGLLLSVHAQQGPVVRRVDNFIQQMNPYPADKTGAYLILIGQRTNFIHWIGIYPLEKVIHSSYNRAKVISTAK